MPEYNASSIRVLKDTEITERSCFGMQAALVQLYPATAEEHLQRVAECLFELGLKIEHYVAYRNGLRDDTFLQMNEYFKQRNKQRSRSSATNSACRSISP